MCNLSKKKVEDRLIEQGRQTKLLLQKVQTLNRIDMSLSKNHNITIHLKLMK